MTEDQLNHFQEYNSSFGKHLLTLLAVDENEVDSMTIDRIREIFMLVRVKASALENLQQHYVRLEAAVANP